MVPEYIVGYDGKAAAQAAIEFTRVLARGTGAEVVAAYVFASIVPLYAFPYAGDALLAVHSDAAAAERATAERVLERVEGVQRRALAGGSVPAELHALARSDRAALLAVGATHRGHDATPVPVHRQR